MNSKSTTSGGQLPVVLVATQGVFARVDLQTGELSVLDEGRGSYYGISWSKDTVWVAARAAMPHRLISFGPDMREQGGIEGLHLGEVDGDSNGPHQVHYQPDPGVLYITDTEESRITVIDPITHHQEHWSWPRIGPADPHINSVWCNWQGLWIVEHRGQHLPKVIRCMQDSKTKAVYPLHLPTLAAGPLQSGLHNVYVENSKIHTLGPAEVVTVDMLTLQTDVYGFGAHVVPGHHYLRGLARQRDRWLPGLSRWIIGRSNASARQDRGYGQSTILTCSNKFDVVAALTLPQGWGQINEIRLVGPDLTHNGLPCPVKWPVEVWPVQL